MAPTVSAQLRDIAGTLRAQIEEGEFVDCTECVQTDMDALPAALERIAKQAEDAVRLAEGRA
jgi:hypothetical protein